MWGLGFSRGLRVSRESECRAFGGGGVRTWDSRVEGLGALGLWRAEG